MAEPPKRPRLTSATVRGMHAAPWRVTNGGSATTSSIPVAAPWSVLPAVNQTMLGASAATAEASANTTVHARYSRRGGTRWIRSAATTTQSAYAALASPFAPGSPELLAPSSGARAGVSGRDAVDRTTKGPRPSNAMAPAVGHRPARGVVRSVRVTTGALRSRAG